MTIRKAVLLLLVMLACWLIVTRPLANNLGSDIRFANDYSDRYIYEQEGLWLSRGQVPYLSILQRVSAGCGDFFRHAASCPFGDRPSVQVA